MREKRTGALVIPAVLAALVSFLSTGCPSTSETKVQATGYDVSAPGYASAGTAVTITVRAVQSGNETVPSYLGTVHFTASDTAAVLPPDYVFTAADQGVHTFSGLAVLKTAGNQTITVTGTAGPALSGSATLVVTGGALAELLAAAPLTTVTAGSLVSLTITARDVYGNTISSYAGTVGFTSTDPANIITPTSYTFQPALDQGSHTFTPIFRSGGHQTVCARDPLAKTTLSNGLVVPLPPVCTNFFVYFYVTDPPVTAYGLGESSGACTPDCPSTVGTLNLRLSLINPTTGLPWPGQAVTATASNPTYPVKRITDLGGGEYLVGVSVSIPSAFYVSVTCPGCPGSSLIWGGLGFTQGTPNASNSSLDAFGTPPEVAVINPAAGTTNTLSTFGVRVSDSVGNPILDSAITAFPTGSALASTILDHLDGSYSVSVFDSVSEVSGVFVLADGTLLGVGGVPGNPVSITYTSLDFPAPVVSVPTGTTSLTATLSVGGTPTAGRTVGMALSPGSSASLGSVTDNGNGTYTASLTDNTAETVTVTASETGISGAKGVVEVQFVGVGLAAITGTTIAAGDGVTVTATITGLSPATGRTVNLTTNSANVSIGTGPVAMTDNGNGTYSVTNMTDPVPETVTFTATDQSGATATINVTFQ